MDSTMQSPAAITGGSDQSPRHVEVLKDSPGVIKGTGACRPDDFATLVIALIHHPIKARIS